MAVTRVVPRTAMQYPMSTSFMGNHVPWRYHMAVRIKKVLAAAIAAGSDIAPIREQATAQGWSTETFDRVVASLSSPRAQASATRGKSAGKRKPKAERQYDRATRTPTTYDKPVMLSLVTKEGVQFKARLTGQVESVFRGKTTFKTVGVAAMPEGDMHMRLTANQVEKLRANEPDRYIGVYGDDGFVGLVRKA